MKRSLKLFAATLLLMIVILPSAFARSDGTDELFGILDYSAVLADKLSHGLEECNSIDYAKKRYLISETERRGNDAERKLASDKKASTADGSLRVEAVDHDSSSFIFRATLEAGSHTSSFDFEIGTEEILGAGFDDEWSFITGHGRKLSDVNEALKDGSFALVTEISYSIEHTGRNAYAVDITKATATLGSKVLYEKENFRSSMIRTEMPSSAEVIPGSDEKEFFVAVSVPSMRYKATNPFGMLLPQSEMSRKAIQATDEKRMEEVRAIEEEQRARLTKEAEIEWEAEAEKIRAKQEAIDIEAAAKNAQAEAEYEKALATAQAKEPETIYLDYDQGILESNAANNVMGLSLYFGGCVPIGEENKEASGAFGLTGQLNAMGDVALMFSFNGSEAVSTMYAGIGPSFWRDLTGSLAARFIFSLGPCIKMPEKDAPASVGIAAQASGDLVLNTGAISLAFGCTTLLAPDAFYIGAEIALELSFEE